MYKYLREEIKNLKAYDVKEREYRVKLDANEGIEWLEGLNRYPVDRSDRLRDLLAQRLNKDPDELLVGNGSSELIELAMKAYLEAGETVVSISPTFSMYRIFTIIHKGRYVDYPLQDMERLDVEGFIEFVEQSGAKLVIISNPNNPTGTLFPREDIMRIVKAVHAMVVLDEAYIEFSDLPLVDETRDNLNLVVLRTFSKAMALAGIRLGYMIGNREIIDYINRVRSPYNVNVLSQELGIKALTSDQSRASIGMVRSERERMKRELEKRGFKPFESHTNFLFFPAKEGLDAALAKRGIMIRGFGGELEGYFRVTIGIPEENDAVLEAIEEVQNERS
jgi:histidinol-phosphate aminotransferase